MDTALTIDEIKDRIYWIRGTQVMLDSDLAKLYEVETKALKRTVRRNMERFPPDFMFELTKAESETLRYQIGTSKTENLDNPLKTHETLRFQFGTSKVENLVENYETRGGDRFTPFVFTEFGVAMLSSVLRSDKAIRVNIAIMRTFIQLRKQRDNQIELFQNFQRLERRFDEFDYRVEQLESKSKRQSNSTSATPGNRQADFAQPSLPVDAANKDVASQVLEIQKAVSKYSGLKINELKSEGRARELVFARQLAIYLIRENLSIGFREIGKYFNDRDHSTVLHSYNKIKLKLKKHKGVQDSLALIQAFIQ
jgi:hypothetical protein